MVTFIGSRKALVREPRLELFLKPYEPLNCAGFVGFGMGCVSSWAFGAEFDRM